MCASLPCGRPRDRAESDVVAVRRSEHAHLDVARGLRTCEERDLAYLVVELIIDPVTRSRHARRHEEREVRRQL